MKIIRSVYTAVVLDHPLRCLGALAVVVVLLGFHAPDFSLDASSDALLLESDSGIEYYRAIRARYGSDDFLILTYTPQDDLFSEQQLARLNSLRDELEALPRVASVVSILDVPLLQSPPLEPRELANGAPTLLDDRTDPSLARTELTESPLYRDRLMSSDGQTTALQINLGRDDALAALLKRRAELREARLEQALTREQAAELQDIEGRINARRNADQNGRRGTVGEVRAIADRYRDDAELHLGGLPMINADMIQFIRHDLVVFGIGLAIALVALLAVIFRRPRWVVLPLVSCGVTVISVVGMLAIADWPVTVVSSNFISLMLILTLSLNIHLVVRYRELHTAHPDLGARELVFGMVENKAWPAFYTALTTMVAFASLLASDIRPVIDFGWMMVIGMGIAFIVTFTWLPAVLMLLPPGEPPTLNRVTNRITGAFMQLIRRYPMPVMLTYGLLAAAAAVGIARLGIDNRFIDYFKESTAIHQGMKVIDERLGGTTPLDVILDGEPDSESASTEDEMDELPGEPGLAARSYWYNTAHLDMVSAAHEYLESREEIGKVLSLSTTVDVLRNFLDGQKLDNFQLSVIYQRTPDAVRAALFEPYLSDDGNQTRLAARVYETSGDLHRNELLTEVRQQLVNELGIAPERVHLTGLMVLYNNVLQSLLRSQILTVGVVSLAILIMFLFSFRSFAVAAISLVPNVVGAALVLGLMSVLGVSLDVMTITIAAIAIGIGVDNTIHYVYRFQEEFAVDQDYNATIERCHRSVGHAMYYTSVTIMLGFSVLALSSFVPTILFGLLTGLAMVVTLIANLTLLPLLLSRLQALGKEA